MDPLLPALGALVIVLGYRVGRPAAKSAWDGYQMRRMFRDLTENEGPPAEATPADVADGITVEAGAPMWSSYRVVEYDGRWYAQRRYMGVLWRCIEHYDMSISLTNTLRWASRWEALYAHRTRKEAAETCRRYAKRGAGPSESHAVRV